MITLKLDLDDVLAGTHLLIERLEDRAAIHKIAGNVLLENNRERFLAEQAPDGSAWASHAPLTNLIRRGRGGILRQSGELFSSIHMSSDASKAEVGTNLDHPKVWANFYGAQIEPVNANVLRVPISNGNRSALFFRRATIPARPFLGIGPDDPQDVKEEIVEFLDQR